MKSVTALFSSVASGELDVYFLFASKTSLVFSDEWHTSFLLVLVEVPSLSAAFFPLVTLSLDFCAETFFNKQPSMVFLEMRC